MVIRLTPKSAVQGTTRCGLDAMVDQPVGVLGANRITMVSL